MLIEVARENRVPIIGLNWRDDDGEARRWIDKTAIRTTSSWSTAKVARRSTSACTARRKPFSSMRMAACSYRHVGAMTREVWQREFLSRLPRGRSAVNARQSWSRVCCGPPRCSRSTRQCCPTRRCKALRKPDARIPLHAVPEQQHRGFTGRPRADLRRDVKELLLAGKTDDEIREYMVQRYGDVILFQPPFKPRTAWVWIAPDAGARGRDPGWHSHRAATRGAGCERRQRYRHERSSTMTQQ